MGLRDWLKGKQQEIEEAKRPKYTEKDILSFNDTVSTKTLSDAAIDVFIEKHPDFTVENKSSIQLVPIDGDELRMALYGCYKGDKVLQNGVETEFTKDEKPQYNFKFGWIRDQEIENSKNIAIASLVNQAKMYLGNFKTGDIVSDNIMSYRYDDKIFGFQAECVERKKPLKDIFVPEVVAGVPVNSLEECFKDCKNVASVVRIPTSANLEYCFEGSGIRELPRNLHLSVDSSYALFGALNLVKDVEQLKTLYHQNPNLFGKEQHIFYEWAETPYDYDVKAGCAVYYIEKEEKKLENLKGLKQDIKDYLDGKNHRIQGFGQVEFVENFEKVTINRMKMDDKWYVFDEGNCSFTFYANLMSYRYRNAQLFPDSSFKDDEISAQKSLESIMKSIDEKIDKQEKEIENKVNKLAEKITSEHELCDKAQEGLDYKAPAEIKIQESKIYEQETNNEER